MSIIEVKNLKKAYGSIIAVNDISFDVNEGELFAFLGVNGAGKSTTINMICSITNPDSGSILINGYKVGTKEAKASIGVVFQGSVLDGRLKVIENLKSRAAYYNLFNEELNKRIDYLVDLLDLSSILNQRYSTLSGGQKRRVDIARALINNPKILFLDEPTTGLDPQSRLMVWNVINDLRKKAKLTVFLTTHYMEETSEADNVVIIDHGEIKVMGSPIELKGKYTKNYIKVYMDRNSDFESRIPIFEYNSNFYSIPFNSSKDVLLFIEKNKEYLNDFEVLKGDMDDVFINVTGRKWVSE